MKKKFLIIVSGPTAIGKTGLSIRLAEKLQTEIVNADSRQVYREIVIGTAMPSLEQLQRVRHHFIGHKSIHENYNASLYEVEAIALLDHLFSRYDQVIMTGGSGMYIDAVCNGIDDIPTVDPQVRQRLQEEYLRMGLSGIRSRLGDLDPEYLKTVDPFNPKRILKALEISETTGRPYSSFLTGISKPRNFSVVKIGLDMPRMELHQRINARVDHMMVQGLLQEAEGLLDYRHLNALNTVGYKELFAYMEGKCTLERAVETIKGHTRQYARRQLTWFRRYHDIGWFLPDAWDQLIDHIHNKIRE